MIIDFNKIYVIQSLDKTLGDDLTGQQLYDEVLQYFNSKYSDKSAKLFNVDTPEELFETLMIIKYDCLNNNLKPIIHFEIHGLKNKTGLSLNKGSVNWGDIYDKLIEINIASKWNLFITMGVCYGNFAMFLIKPRHPAPFTGILGSFESLFEWDLYIRFNSFYQELLYSLDFDKALDALHNSNPALPDDYRYINSEQTFKNIYQKYFNAEFSPEKIRKRFKDSLKEEGMKFSDRNIRQKYSVQFHAKLMRTKKQLYEEDKKTFFMFDLYPEHKLIYCIDWEPNFG
jgi:hypothetical protein